MAITPALLSTNLGALTQTSSYTVSFSSCWFQSSLKVYLEPLHKSSAILYIYIYFKFFLLKLSFKKAERKQNVPIITEFSFCSF